MYFQRVPRVPKSDPGARRIVSWVAEEEARKAPIPPQCGREESTSLKNTSGAKVELGASEYSPTSAERPLCRSFYAHSASPSPGVESFRSPYLPPNIVADPPEIIYDRKEEYGNGSLKNVLAQFEASTVRVLSALPEEPSGPVGTETDVVEGAVSQPLAIRPHSISVSRRRKSTTEVSSILFKFIIRLFQLEQPPAKKPRLGDIESPSTPRWLSSPASSGPVTPIIEDQQALSLPDSPNIGPHEITVHDLVEEGDDGQQVVDEQQAVGRAFEDLPPLMEDPEVLVDAEQSFAESEVSSLLLVRQNFSPASRKRKSLDQVCFLSLFF